jgi:hypothetical protein
MIVIKVRFEVSAVSSMTGPSALIGLIVGLHGEYPVIPGAVLGRIELK